MKKRILVIDDDATIRFFLEKILENSFEVISKSDGFEAITWLNSGNIPDLIILDMEMPNMNGRVFLRRIKSSPVQRNVPVIIVSGTDSRSIMNTFFKLGAADYLVKPFRDVNFVERIEKWLR